MYYQDNKLFSELFIVYNKIDPSSIANEQSRCALFGGDLPSDLRVGL